MLQLVDVGKQAIEAYLNIVGKEAVAELKELARPLAGLRLAHINATPYGGGVSELLRSIVPLEQNLGIRAEWRVISGDEKFFNVTKRFHNALQGQVCPFTKEEEETYLVYNIRNARLLEDEYDAIIIHDPQPAALRAFCKTFYPHKNMNTKWIWRCHIDTSQPCPDYWRFLRDYIADYDAVIFTMADFVPPDFKHQNIVFIPPAIDPLSPKNLLLSDDLAQNILDWIGIYPEEPFITQISRFDPWKDPFGVIEVYRLVQKEFPHIHLALVGSMALDDPEGWEIYEKIMVEDSKDPYIHVFTNLIGVSNIEVNAFQHLAQVVIQKSIREGFGLVVSESLWKGTPVVAGKTGGIPMQLQDGGGFLVTSIQECAERVIYLLSNPEEAKFIGQQGKEGVRKKFLITRLLRDELRCLLSLTG